MRESEGSFFGDYGIECGRVIPEHEGLYNVANTIRACLDLLYERNFPTAQGMRHDFICNDKYDGEIFELVSRMRGLPYWEDIDRFMEREYRMKWRSYKHGREWTEEPPPVQGRIDIDKIPAEDLNGFARRTLYDFIHLERLSDLDAILRIVTQRYEELDEGTLSIISTGLITRDPEEYEHIILTQRIENFTSDEMKMSFNSALTPLNMNPDAYAF